MGEKGKSIVDLNVDELIAELKKAYLDELLAFYSYWLTTQVAEGFHGEELVENFTDEAKDELSHAERLAQRIIELGGDPIVHPKDWEKGANAPFTPPRADWSDADGMVADQLAAERGAIEAYNRIAKMTFGKDAVTHALVTEILQDEVGHEEFMEGLLGRNSKRR